jgi:hypothetical protein
VHTQTCAGWLPFAREVRALKSGFVFAGVAADAESPHGYQRVLLFGKSEN